MPPHLPPEILLETFAYLDPVDNRRDMKHLHIEQGSLFNKLDLPASLETLVMEDYVRPVFKMLKFLV